MCVAIVKRKLGLRNRPRARLKVFSARERFFHPFFGDVKLVESLKRIFRRMVLGSRGSVEIEVGSPFCSSSQCTLQRVSGRPFDVADGV